MHPYIEHVNPNLGELLTKIGLDKCFVKGEGCHLYDQDGNTYLDLIAAYGALPFGFNPPQIWEAIRQVEASCEPSFVQPSLLAAAGALARRLLELAPGWAKSHLPTAGRKQWRPLSNWPAPRLGRKGLCPLSTAFTERRLELFPPQATVVTSGLSEPRWKGSALCPTET